MNSSTEILKKQLTEWRKFPPDKIPPQEDAKRLLDSIKQALDFLKERTVDYTLWHECLKITGNYSYMRSLSDRVLLEQWAEAVFQIIRYSNFTLRDLFTQRSSTYTGRILFREMTGSSSSIWTYEQIDRHIKEIAAVFHTAIKKEEPRVAILAENSVESSCCDLACLFYDILNTPLNIHFDPPTLVEIFNQLQINIVVTDTLERFEKLQEVQKSVQKSFITFLLDPNIPIDGKTTIFLGETCKKLSSEEEKNALQQRNKRQLNQVTTVMFTSGSTGMPKGVCFSQYNLITKRFARGAALPEIGQNEVFLSYLPLYHTFGRFLELLGSIYWAGTYVFPDNRSAETLISLFPKINPTIFISVPHRWVQLQENCLERMDPIPNPEIQSIAFRSVVGNKLRWGLSAAGYLDPKIFHFFQRNGVDLCSGFGMTEAAGGITMTPPGHYVDNTHGIPLPGSYMRLTENGELLVRGPYIARYLDEIGSDGLIPYPSSPDRDYWLSSGDLFQLTKEGYYEIVDRIKDIYKNNKGQTIAPRKIENKFVNVPGIKRTFLVGDSKPYNVLFIIPDREDPVLKASKTTDNQREYFHQIVAAANKDLAPFERVVNFDILERDFELKRNELTPKGSFNRKTIANNFNKNIELLYKSNHIDLKLGKIKIRLPRWFFRDLGILEDDIQISNEGLINLRSNILLPIKKENHSQLIQIGDLEYQLSNESIDLGLIARQPRLWLGNPSLILFCPIKDGWDVPLESVSGHVFRPFKLDNEQSWEESFDQIRITNSNLKKLNKLITLMLFSRAETSINALEEVSKKMRRADGRTAEVIHRRIEALARHPDENVRCLAYKILLLDEPDSDYSKAFPAFIQSGLSFLNENSIEAIAFTKLEKHRLEALRQRLFNYRLQLEWPIEKANRQQFSKLFQMLVSFVSYHPEFYNSVRAELASWIIHKSDPELSKTAQIMFTKLFKNFEATLEAETPDYSDNDWESRLVFDDGISQNEINRIKKVLIGTTFLKQSIILAFDENNFELINVPRGGIWISRLQSSHYYLLYRMSINTIDRRHFDMQLILRESLQTTSILDEIHWLETVSGYPFGPPILPRLGCYRPELGARSMVYMNEISVWGRIRQFSSLYFTGGPFPKPDAWRKIFVSAMEAFFRGWRNSGYRIVPGAISPQNVVVPELDFREGATILSLIGWCEYKNTLSLIQPMLKNFYQRTEANYPWCQAQLNINWIFHACIEALGKEKADEFLHQLGKDLKTVKIQYNGKKFLAILTKFLSDTKDTYFMPLPLTNAIERYHHWARVNPKATSNAREQTVIELFQLYRLDRFPEITRYYLYYHTYFCKTSKKSHSAFNQLLKTMQNNRQIPAIQLLELSDLQSTITNNEDREVFSRMVFPHFQSRQRLEVLKIGERKNEQVIVHSTITDKYRATYTIRSPVEPAEIGQLYRIFFNENFPMRISEQDKHFVIIDRQERVVGGVCYQLLEDQVVQLEGTVVASPLKERGIGSAVIEDFCNRMAGIGIRVIKAHFFLQPFYEKRGFRVDKSWGALVKFITPEKKPLAEVEQTLLEENRET